VTVQPLHTQQRAVIGDKPSPELVQVLQDLVREVRALRAELAALEDRVEVLEP